MALLRTIGPFCKNEVTELDFSTITIYRLLKLDFDTMTTL